MSEPGHFGSRAEADVTVGSEVERRSKKRALTFAGGGPAVGIGLGVLQALQEYPEITFDVWSLSCVGAWLGCLYHVSPKRSQQDKLKFVEGTYGRLLPRGRRLRQISMPHGLCSRYSRDYRCLSELCDGPAFLFRQSGHTKVRFGRDIRIHSDIVCNPAGGVTGTSVILC